MGPEVKGGAAAGRWYFGWNIVVAAALLTLLSVGMRLGIDDFNAHDGG